MHPTGYMDTIHLKDKKLREHGYIFHYIHRIGHHYDLCTSSNSRKMDGEAGEGTLKTKIKTKARQKEKKIYHDELFKLVTAPSV